MRSSNLRRLVLSLALLVGTAKVQAVGICDWDQRTYTDEQNETTFSTVRSGPYSNGFFGETPFTQKRLSKTFCYQNNVKFTCVYADVGNVLATNITVPNITHVDRIYIKSKYPVTIHRLEQYVKNKEAKDRFIVEKNMALSQCPKYRQTGLTWKFPGTVESRSEFECFHEGMQLCKGVTTGNETGKCVVRVEGKNLVHRRVVNASNNGVEFFYCYLDKTTPQHALTYNVDWRHSSAIPQKGVPLESLFSDMQTKTTVVAPTTTSAAQHLTALWLGSFVALVAALAAQC